jgi:hypothetical protein
VNLHRIQNMFAGAFVSLRFPGLSSSVHVVMLFMLFLADYVKDKRFLRYSGLLSTMCHLFEAAHWLWGYAGYGTHLPSGSSSNMT